MDKRLISDRFPRASSYHPEWVLAGVSGVANPLWLTEWLTESACRAVVDHYDRLRHD